MAAGKSLDMTRRSALYRLYDSDGALLYIGVAFNPNTRYYRHASTKIWWPEVARKEVEWYPNRREAEAAERSAVLAEQPRYNVSGRIESLPPKPRRIRPVASPELAEDLGRAGRNYQRSKRAEERARERLGATIHRAADAGIGPAEITRLIGWQLTERTVLRILSDRDAKSA